MFIPDMYYKDVFSINYNKLKSEGIKVLIFDLDNTIRDINETIKELKEYQTRNDIKELFKELKNDFRIFIVSNNISPKKVEFYANHYEVEFVTSARKPFHRGFKKVLKVAKKNEMCAIGDQMLTDIWAAKTFGIKSVLVDRFGTCDAVFTLINRKIENMIMKKYEKNEVFKKGQYYD